MKKVDLSESYDEPAVASKPAKPRKYYPSLHLSRTQLAKLGLNDAKLGAEVEIKVVVKVSGIHEREGEPRNVSLEMISAEVPSNEADHAKALYTK